MPTYEYTCPKCQQRDTLVRPVDQRDTHRLTCCGRRMERIVFNAVPASFRGAPFSASTERKS